MGFRLRHGQEDIGLREGALVVGRTDDCDLVLDDASVSRQHATFHVSCGQLVIEDLGSRNGVLVNGQLVTGRARVRAGDKVTLGTVEIAVLEGAAAPSPKAAPRAVVARLALKRVASGDACAEEVDTALTRVADVMGDGKRS